MEIPDLQFAPTSFCPFSVYHREEPSSVTLTSCHEAFIWNYMKHEIIWNLSKTSLFHAKQSQLTRPLLAEILINKYLNKISKPNLTVISSIRKTSSSTAGPWHFWSLPEKAKSGGSLSHKKENWMWNRMVFKPFSSCIKGLHTLKPGTVWVHQDSINSCCRRLVKVSGHW